mgnify:CR=1 FL=1
MINTVIVIPSYNEEKRLPIREFDEFIFLIEIGRAHV